AHCAAADEGDGVLHSRDLPGNRLAPMPPLPDRIVRCVDRSEHLTFRQFRPSRPRSRMLRAQEPFMTALTSDIARFVASAKAAAMPQRCQFGARVGMLDCVGTMIAGADEDAVKLVAQIVPTSTSNDGAPEIPGGRNLSAGDAALVNGVAA